MKLYLPFTVQHAATCDGSCDCIDSCPINYETQQLTAMDIIQIGTTSDGEWVERIEQEGKTYTQEQVVEAVLRNAAFCALRCKGLQLPKITKDMCRKIGGVGVIK